MHYHWLIIILSLVLSAFFSGMEIAFVSSNKLRFELRRKQGLFPSGIIARFTKKPAEFIATMLIGNNIALVVYGIFMAIILEPVISRFVSSELLVLLIQTIVSTLIILITAEFMPKTIFKSIPNTAMNVFALPVFIFYILLYPVTRLTIAISNLLLKSFFKVNVNGKPANMVFGRVDLDDFFTEMKQTAEPQEEIDHDMKMFQNALDFDKVKLRECMVPRTEIDAIEVNESIGNLKEIFINTGYSRVLVFEESIDNIIGYANSSGLFKNPQSIRSMLISIPIVPESMPANKLLAKFIEERKNIAVVVDEFGGTAGMVTLEDIVEEIFGEIEDEHDVPEYIDKKISDTEFVFSGRLEIDHINDKYQLSIPESDEYETIAGFILCHHQNIPKFNETIKINNLQFKILKVTHTKIEIVRLQILEEDS